jgi:hypothetical protein
MTPQQLVELFDQPSEAARQGAATRSKTTGDIIEIRREPVRAREFAPGSWPDAIHVDADEQLVIKTEPTPAGRAAFAHWLTQTGPSLPSGTSVAPTSTQAAGLHRLWCFAAARIALPPGVRVEARHDLVGIRLAQLALGFGADTLCGPLDTDRRLPVAGVTRPNENTPSGLATLVRQAGLTPQDVTR